MSTGESYSKTIITRIIVKTVVMCFDMAPDQHGGSVREVAASGVGRQWFESYPHSRSHSSMSLLICEALSILCYIFCM